MNEKELRQQLDALGIAENQYSINQGLKENALILEDMSGFWKLSHYERGHEELIQIFRSKSEAFESLLQSFKEKN